MAQKDKVKELVGRGLGSYHTKALQQIDRIEKKNKEQSHKISILTNELDNDYLTKTEEGSIISLEHSKEGMIYLDELQGNTLVNYCTDGAKELTLNGDIDVEGTNVTITEGVDNGLVDVVCEGNTLVNLVKGYINGGVSGSHMQFSSTYRAYYTDMIKPNTIYTIITYKNGNRHLVCDSEYFSEDTSFELKLLTSQINDPNDYIVTKVTTSENAKYMYLYSTNNSSFEAKVMFLEGDWTNKEIPKEHFEGIKSVGELEDNKFEILSKKEHLVWEQGTLANANGQPNVNNTRIRTVDFFDGNNVSVVNYDKSKYYILYMGYDENKNYVYSSGWIKSSTCPKNYPYIKLVLKIDETTNFAPNDLKEDIYFDRNYNKKEISLNEPLRAIGDNKDKFVKQGAKWYVERRNGKFVVDGSDVAYTNIELYPSDNAHCILTSKLNNLKLSGEILCDKVPAYDSTIWLATDIGDKCGVSTVSASWGFAVRLTNNLTGVNKTDDGGTVKSKFRTYLQSNPITIIYQLETPTYEPITDAELITYLDTTHISNNSTIPCNMKIQNSGYNAIIKPSTLYTVAFDTDKSREVGINLAGTKVTTTNNVATITTPTTLTDDSLRLYGKGLKGSKVRLLEGDKTNWMPSYFEGMQSCFEDKLQDNGTYKVEILSNNKNLIDIERMLNKDNYLKGTYSSIKIPLKPNTTYYFKCNFKPNNIHRWIGVFSEPLGYNGTLKKALIWNDNLEGIREGSFITDKSTDYYLSIYQPNVSYLDDTWYEELFTSVYSNFIISEVDKNYIEPKSNKIQFSSIEPLRGVGNIKDRFVFKDSKFMIERNCKSIRLNDETIASYTVYNTEYNGTMLPFSMKTKAVDTKKGKFVQIPCNCLATHEKPTYKSVEVSSIQQYIDNSACFVGSIKVTELTGITKDSLIEYFNNNNISITYQLAEPIYEEIPFELQKIILEGYEDGTLFFDTNIPPTSTVTYAGETPIVKATRLNKTEVLNNTEDINDNIVPYLMDMDYRVVCLQLEVGTENVSMARLFGGTFEMLQRDILSNRYSKDEYKHRLDVYLSANKITENEYEKLGDMLND